MVGILRERQPWQGKVHNPYKLWIEEQAKHQNVSVEQFQKSLKENVVKTQELQDKRLTQLEETVGGLDKKMDQLLDALTGSTEKK